MVFSLCKGLVCSIWRHLIKTHIPLSLLPDCQAAAAANTAAAQDQLTPAADPGDLPVTHSSEPPRRSLLFEFNVCNLDPSPANCGRRRDAEVSFVLHGPSR